MWTCRTHRTWSWISWRLHPACERAGAQGITVHLRADRRHIQDRDVFRLRGSIITKLNLEMGNTPDPQLRQAVVALGEKLDELWNNNDPAALATLFTEDAVLVNDTGSIFGREAIAKYYAAMFQQGHFSSNLTTFDQNSPHSIGSAGNEMWETGGWSKTIQVRNFDPIHIKGYFSSIAVREGGVWKFRMLTSNLDSGKDPFRGT